MICDSGSINKIDLTFFVNLCILKEVSSISQNPLPFFPPIRHWELTSAEKYNRDTAWLFALANRWQQILV